MKKQTIQKSERYEAPKVKVKVLERRASLCALSLGGGTESTESIDGYSTESYGEENGAW